MFDEIRKINNKIQKLDANDLLQDIVQERQVSDLIIELNQNQLYEEGKFADGSPTGQYALSTIVGTAKFEGKIEKGQRYDHVTLKDTGKFYDSMKVEVGSGDGFKITGDPTDPGQSVAEEALGLTEESLEVLRPEIKQWAIEKIKDKILT